MGSGRLAWEACKRAAGRLEQACGTLVLVPVKALIDTHPASSATHQLTEKLSRSSAGLFLLSEASIRSSRMGSFWQRTQLARAPIAPAFHGASFL